MTILVCPGIHSPKLTQSFLTGLGQSRKLLILPTDRYPPYCAYSILEFLSTARKQLISESSTSASLIFVAFSAGVVGAAAAASLWQLWGGTVTALIALDGWGVPLMGSFPSYRISHDAFTHWSSRLLGAGEGGFYADPAVAHLDLWRSPQTTYGWWLPSSNVQSGKSSCNRACSNSAYIYTTAAIYLNHLLDQYVLNQYEADNK